MASFVKSALQSLQESARLESTTKLKADIESCLALGIPVGQVEHIINGILFKYQHQPQPQHLSQPTSRADPNEFRGSSNDSSASVRHEPNPNEWSGQHSGGSSNEYTARFLQGAHSYQGASSAASGDDGVPSARQAMYTRPPIPAFRPEPGRAYNSVRQQTAPQYYNTAPSSAAPVYGAAISAGQQYYQHALSGAGHGAGTASIQGNEQDVNEEMPTNDPITAQNNAVRTQLADQADAELTEEDESMAELRSRKSNADFIANTTTPSRSRAKYPTSARVPAPAAPRDDTHEPTPSPANSVPTLAAAAAAAAAATASATTRSTRKKPTAATRKAAKDPADDVDNEVPAPRKGGGRPHGYVKHQPTEPDGKPYWAYPDGSRKGDTPAKPAAKTPAKDASVPAKKGAYVRKAACKTAPAAASTAKGFSLKRKASTTRDPANKRARATSAAEEEEEEEEEEVEVMNIIVADDETVDGTPDNGQEDNNSGIHTNSGSSDEDISAVLTPAAIAQAALAAAAAAASAAPVADMGAEPVPAMQESDDDGI